MRYFHGSPQELEIGRILGKREGYEQSWSSPDQLNFYDVLEAFRPEGCAAHRDAVFMTADLDDIDLCGGNLDLIYELRPLAPVSRHDLNWASEISSLFDDYETLTKAEFMANPEAYPYLKAAALNYWNGIPHHNEQVWEYISTSAEVVALVEDNRDEPEPDDEIQHPSL